LHIRTATLTDIDAIRAVGIAAWYDTYVGLVPDDYIAWALDKWWSPEDIQRHIDSSQFIVLVAEVDRQVVGIAHTQIRPDVTAIVWRLYVRQAHRGRGIGKQLITASEQRLPSSTRRLCIEYYQANTRAAAFYARLGFVFDRIETVSFQNVPIVSVFVSRALHADAAESQK
jgi:ribosomal protein S18 acetylase RimI-like enzyme